MSGAGGNSELHHIPKLQAMEGVTIVAVANRTLKSAQRIADKFKIKEVRHPKTQDTVCYSDKQEWQGLFCSYIQ